MILDLGFRMIRSWISDDQRSQEKRWCFTSMSWTPLRTYNNFLVMIMLVVVILMMIRLVVMLLYVNLNIFLYLRQFPVGRELERELRINIILMLTIMKKQVIKMKMQSVTFWFQNFSVLKLSQLFR